MILRSDGGKGGPARLPVKQVDDERRHDRTPLFDQSHCCKSWFQAGFDPDRKLVSSRLENGFLGRTRASGLDAGQRFAGLAPYDFFDVRSTGLPAAQIASTVLGVQIMFRKSLIALTAVLAVSLFAPSEASAWRGGFHGGGFHGGGWHGGGWGPGLGLAAVGIGLGLAAAPFAYGGYGYPYGYAGYPYGYGGYGVYGGCYLVRQQVMTPYGWRWRRVQVCD